MLKHIYPLQKSSEWYTPPLKESRRGPLLSSSHRIICPRSAAALVPSFIESYPVINVINGVPLARKARHTMVTKTVLLIDASLDDLINY